MSFDQFVGDCRYITMQTKQVYTVRKYWKKNELFLSLNDFCRLIFNSLYCNGIMIRGHNSYAKSYRPYQYNEAVIVFYHTEYYRL